MRLPLLKTGPVATSTRFHPSPTTWVSHDQKEPGGTGQCGPNQGAEVPDALPSHAWVTSAAQIVSPSITPRKVGMGHGPRHRPAHAATVVLLWGYAV